MLGELRGEDPAESPAGGADKPAGGAHAATLRQGGWSKHKEGEKEWDHGKYLGVHKSNDPHMAPIRKLIERSVEGELAKAIDAKQAMRSKKQTEEDTEHSLGQRKAKKQSLAAAGITLEVPSGIFSGEPQGDLWAAHQMWRSPEGRMTWSLCTVGKLTKLGAKRKNWKEREFILQDEIHGEPYLAYYEPGHSQTIARVPCGGLKSSSKGRVNLSNWKNTSTGPMTARLYPVQPASVSNADAPNTDFEVISPERTFVLRAESEAKMKALVEFLKTVQYSTVWPDVTKAKAFIDSGPDEFAVIRFKQDGPLGEDDDSEGEYEPVGGGTFAAGDIVDIESEGGWERGAIVLGAALSVRLKIIRNELIKNVCKCQSCMVSKLRIIFKRTRIPREINKCLV